MRIAAFDLGSTWAITRNQGPNGPWTQHAGLEGKRPEKLAGFIVALSRIPLREVDVVVYERPFARGQAATRMLWGMAGILEAAAHNAGVAVLDITPAEIKKWATGKGTASKGEMIAAAQRLGYAGENEHEADAFCLLCMAEATLTSTKGP